MSMKVEDNIFKFYRGKRVLVTGHTGFIGSWLTKWLTLMDTNVCGFSLDPPSSPNLYELLKVNESVIDIRGDIRDKNLLQSSLNKFKPEIVIHLASQPLVLDSYSNPLETYDVNVTGTANLLNELRKIETLKTIIVVTSDKSYHNNEWVYPYREIDPLGGTDPYSASKSCQDIVVNSFRESFFLDSEVGISSVRSGNVICGGDWAPHRIIPDLVRGIVKGETVRIRNPLSVRPWQHVLEPISGILTLVERMNNDIKFAGAWNFGPENNVEITVKELVDAFINCWGSGNYSIDEMQNYKEASYLRLDISKAKSELKWKPRYDFRVALQETVDWYREYYKCPSTMGKKTDAQIEKYCSISNA